MRLALDHSYLPQAVHQHAHPAPSSPVRLCPTTSLRSSGHVYLPLLRNLRKLWNLRKLHQTLELRQDSQSCRLQLPRGLPLSLSVLAQFVHSCNHHYIHKTSNPSLAASASASSSTSFCVSASSAVARKGKERLDSYGQGPRAGHRQRRMHVRYQHQALPSMCARAWVWMWVCIC